MSFNVFGPTTKKDIRVGYISTERGYVKGISVLEANQYAFKNPGTQFILETRDSTRYLSINEVNKLTPNDILPAKNASQGTCDGITGLEPNVGISTTRKPVVIFSGGSGVGAQGNPVIGTDGSLLDVIVTNGGFGYKFPPNVSIVDPNRVGAGAVAISSLCTTTVDILEEYNLEEDFEEYDFSAENGPDQLSGYGLRFGVDGEVIGEWDPSLYSNFAEDPIGIEVQKYQDFLKELENPWWHTRKEKPLAVTFNDKTSRVVHNVDFPQWDDKFMNQYAICPVPKSDVPGSDYAGRWCTFEWEENFPYTGEYIFRGMADNISKVYLDNDVVMDPRNFKGGPLPKDTVKKTVESGVHRIKIDLFNVPQYEKPEPTVPQDLTITYHGLSQGSTKTVSGEKSYAIRTEGASGTAGRRVRNNGREIQFDDDISNGFDENASLKIESTSPGVSAKFNGDGTQLIVKGRGDVSLKFSWDDNPKTKGLSVGTLKVGNGSKVSWTTRQRGNKGSDRKTINVGREDSREVIGKGGFIVSGDKKKIKMKDGQGDDINSTFSITSSTNNARFSDDGKRIETDGPGEVKLKLEWDDNPKTAGVAVDKIVVGGVVLDQRGTRGSDTKTLVVKGAPNQSTSSNQSQQSETIFSTLDYIKKADRKLWRTNVFGQGGFLGEYGICPFDTRNTLKDNPYDGTHVIRWEHVTFPADGNYKIDIEVDDRVKLFIGNRSGSGAMGIGNGLKDIEQGGDEVIIEKDGFIGDTSKGTGKSTYTKFFKKGQYRIRAELYQKPGGRFGFGEKSGEQAKLKGQIVPRFTREGNNLFMIVDGQGSGTINFSLKVDDNPRVAGDSLGSLRVGTVNLKRSKQTGRGRRGYKEKEVISGSGTFEAGQKYKIIVGGSSAGVQSPRVFTDRIEFLDTGGNDTNATLSVSRVSNVQPERIKGLNPMALAIRITSELSEVTRISARTWNQNPFGAALTIEAPLPPIPESPRVLSEGRCPENPTWTTRFPGAAEKWWPVTHIFADGTRSWSKFMNRYAISPIPPLSTPNSDGGGIIYSNSWEIDVPFEGFHGMKGTVDNGGRILVDGQVIMQGGYFTGAKFAGDVRSLEGFRTAAPKIKKFFLSKGKHTITVEVENRNSTKQKRVEKKIFNTQDWIKKGKSNSGTVDVDFKVTTEAGFGNGVELVGEFKFEKSYNGSQLNETTTKTLEIGKVYDVIFTSPQTKEGIRLRTAGENVVQMEEATDNDWKDLVISASKGKFYDFNGARCKYVVESKGAKQTTRSQDGVTYSGPELFQINSPTTVNNWSNFMRRNAISPLVPPINEDNPAIADASFTFTWSNVNFPESGRYKVLFQTDNIGELYINGQLIKETRSFRGEPQISYAEISAGNYEVKVVCTNGRQPENVLTGNNPTGFALKLMKDVVISETSFSWQTNPVGISAILIPPPCPKVISGKGVVCDVIVKQPGNGYVSPPGPSFPSLVVVKNILIDTPGINYSPDDNVLIDGNPVPICKIDGFGRVLEVCPLPSPIFVTAYPSVTLPSNTGVGFRGTPIMETIVVPEDVFDEEQLVQVTDLVGLKRTGYVNGKPYYGSVFSKDGQLYAGVYETIGELIPVYATLQESIDNRVTTRPSAIIRQGTDVNSNNPRLNIPGTPQNLI